MKQSSLLLTKGSPLNVGAHYSHCFGRAELSDMVGLQPALPHMGRTGYDLAEKARAQRLAHLHQPPPAQSLDRAAAKRPGPVAEGTEEPHVELSRFSMAASMESCDVYGAPAPMLISRYERNPPPEMIEGRPGQLTCLQVRLLLLRFCLVAAICSMAWPELEPAANVE